MSYKLVCCVHIIVSVILLRKGAEQASFFVFCPFHKRCSGSGVELDCIES